jgi:hypothetical protein
MSTMEEENARLTITISGTHGETLTITDAFERHGVLDGELLVHVRGPKGASKYLFTTSWQELARLAQASCRRVSVTDVPPQRRGPSYNSSPFRAERSGQRHMDPASTWPRPDR